VGGGEGQSHKERQPVLSLLDGYESHVPGYYDLNSKNYQVISMCEVLERRIITRDLPYNLEESSGEREITRGL
jgi:hypothetical protein